MESLSHWPNSKYNKPRGPHSGGYSTASHYSLTQHSRSVTHASAQHKQVLYINCVLTVGGDRLTVDPRRSWGPMLECRLMGSPPPPGVPPGEEAQDGAMRIFGGIMRALSERRRFGNALWTLRKLLSGDDGEAPNHQPPKTPESVAFGLLLLTCTTVTTARLEQVHGSWSLHRTQSLHHPAYPGVIASVFRDIVKETHWVTEIGIRVGKTDICTGRLILLVDTVTPKPCSVHT